MKDFPEQSDCMRRMRHKVIMGSENGFTLIELLMVVVLTSVILTLAVPSFMKSIRENRAQTAANGMAVAINTAKAEAIRRGRYVTVCPSSDAATCSTDWAKGWIVVVDKAATVTGNPDIDVDVADGGILQTGSEMKALVVSKTAGGANAWLRFSARGLLLGEAAGITLQVKSETCPAGTAFRELAVGVAGRVSVTKSTCT